jgi:hypothetical protein
MTDSMMTPKEYAFFDSALAPLMGLPEQEWGALFCTDEHGHRWTLLTADVVFWRMLVKAPDRVRAGIEIPRGKFRLRRPGWPDEW